MLISSIAFFILGTTKPFTDRSSYESRIIPIRETWGKSLEHLYFVMGTNAFDYYFLKQRCRLTGTYPEVKERPPSDFIDESNMKYQRGRRRKLIPRVKQVDSQNVTLEYVCNYGSNYKLMPEFEDRIKFSQELPATMKWIAPEATNKQLDVLMVHNCTGEYFGRGPTCRCQESMRYYNHHSRPGGKFEKVEWFAFIDDDLYVRPYSLLSLLQSRFATISGGPDMNMKEVVDWCHDPAVVISIRNTRTFEFSRRWNRTLHQCYGKGGFRGRFNWKDHGGTHALYIAMPAIMNRGATDLLRSAIDANGMTGLQSLWGGTHDMILALLNYMYTMPLFSVGQSYYTGFMYLEQPSTLGYKSDEHLFVHMVKNMKRTKKVKKKRNFNESSTDSEIVLPREAQTYTVPSMVTIEEAFEDNLVRVDGAARSIVAKEKRITDQGAFTYDQALLTQQTKQVMAKAMRQQKKFGVDAGELLISFPPTGVNQTIFAGKAKNLEKHFELFTFEDCAYTRN